MPARTFLVAAAGAVTGALATALLLTSRAPPPPPPTASSRLFRPTAASGIVDPAGIFQYGW